ncbi:hypothetical protein DFH28DRAFT_401882 [Melampsora americana]|nr:hypothetical protein DFH28DRAFT_401882 [Melampsora americana]
MSGFQSHSNGSGRPHLRTNSKPMTELGQPTISFSQHTYTTLDSEGVHSRPSPFTTVATPSIEIDQVQLPTIKEHEPEARPSPKATALGLVPISRKEVSVGTERPSLLSIISSLLRRTTRLQEILYPLLFFTSLVAFLAPLAGIGYQPPMSAEYNNIKQDSAHFPDVRSPLQRLNEPFPLHLTPVSTKEIGTLFADALKPRKKSHHGAVTSHTFSQTASDSEYQDSGLKPMIEPHDSGKVDLVQASDDHLEEKEESLFSEVLASNESEDLARRSIQEMGGPQTEKGKQEEEQAVEQDEGKKEENTEEQNKEEKEAEKRKEAEEDEDFFYEEDPEISDDTESPDETEYSPSMIPSSETTRSEDKENQEKEVEQLNLEPVEVLVKQESKIKELEFLLQSISPPDNEIFPDPSFVEEISGRKGLRARHFR